MAAVSCDQTVVCLLLDWVAFILHSSDVVKIELLLEKKLSSFGDVEFSSVINLVVLDKSFLIVSMYIA